MQDPIQHCELLTTLMPNLSLLFGEGVGQRYAVDSSSEKPLLPSLVARPRSTSELSQLLAYCNKHRVSVVVQGGMTGLAGGATPQRNEIALSMELMSGVVEVDTESMTITARAGTPLAVLQQAAIDVGLRLPLDLGARGSCSIGGNVSTNAGGNQVVSYGMARSLVLGLEAVLADGTVVSSLNKMLKNNAGYDLKQLFIGSEGTLGVVTQVVMRLYPGLTGVASALCAVSSFTDVVQLLKNIQQQPGRLSAFEVMWPAYYRGVFDYRPSLIDPMLTSDASELVVLVELEGANNERFEQQLGADLEAGRINNAIVAQSQKERDNFWAIRDGVADILSQEEHFANFDIGIPINKMGEFVAVLERTMQSRFQALTLYIFGHIADGNLHIIAWTEHAEDVDRIYQVVYPIVGEFSGTITAEHGVGIHKRKYLCCCRSSEEIALMQRLKKAMDPNNILNPGRVFEG